METPRALSTEPHEQNLRLTSFLKIRDTNINATLRVSLAAVNIGKRRGDTIFAATNRSLHQYRVNQAQLIPKFTHAKYVGT